MRTNKLYMPNFVAVTRKCVVVHWVECFSRDRLNEDASIEPSSTKHNGRLNMGVLIEDFLCAITATQHTSSQ